LPKNRGYQFKSIQKSFLVPKDKIISKEEKFSDIRSVSVSKGGRLELGRDSALGALSA